MRFPYLGAQLLGRSLGLPGPHPPFLRCPLDQLRVVVPDPGLAKGNGCEEGQTVRKGKQCPCCCRWHTLMSAPIAILRIFLSLCVAIARRRSASTSMGVKLPSRFRRARTGKYMRRVWMCRFSSAANRLPAPASPFAAGSSASSSSSSSSSAVKNEMDTLAPPLMISSMAGVMPW